LPESVGDGGLELMSRRTTLVVVACVLTLLLTACERQKIGDITSDPGRFQGKEVSVAGQVTGFSVGALGMGLYQIDDGTGKLYVLSETRGAPTKGATVGVKGTIMPTFTFLGKNYATVLKETGRKGVRNTTD
jgi:hypothetical protein